MEVLVLEDYQAQREDELTLAAGDVLRQVGQGSEDGWLLGELAGRRGLFPTLIVLEIPESLWDDGGPRRPRRPRSTRQGQPGGPPTTQRWCKVNFSYSPEQPDELKLQAGEMVQVLREIEDGWWLGKKNGQLGAFPSNFVQELDYRPSGAAIPDVIPKATGVAQSCPKLTWTQEETPVYPKTAPESCRVLFDYEPEAPDELALQRGTVVKVLRKITEDPGWWEGEFEGKRGVFPDNFVLLLPSIKKLPVRRLSPQESVFGRENHVSSGRRQTSKDTRAAKESKKMESKITLPPIKKLSASNRPSKPRPPTPRPLTVGSAGDKLKSSREPGGGGGGGSGRGRSDANAEGAGPGVTISLTLPVPDKSNDRNNDGVNDSKRAHSTHIRSKPQGRYPPSFDQTPAPGQEEEKPSLTKSRNPRTKQQNSDKAASRDKSSHEKAPSREKKPNEKTANLDKTRSSDKGLHLKSSGKISEDKDEDEKAPSRTSSADQTSINPLSMDKPTPPRKLSSERPSPDKPAFPEQPESDSQAAKDEASFEQPVAKEMMPEIALSDLAERVDQMETEILTLKGMLLLLVSQQEKDLAGIQEELRKEREMRLELQAKFEMLKSKTNEV